MSSETQNEPPAREEPPPHRDGRARVPMPATKLKCANILLVDDDRRNLNALESILDSPEYRLFRAQSADEALRAIMQEDFAVLVLDVRMPHVDGLELAQMIKQRKKTQHIPIIFLSAYYQEEAHALLGYDAGAVDYLTKPLNPVVLRSKVAAFVGIYRMTRVLQDEIAERRVAERRLAERTSEVQDLVIQLRAMAMELTQTEQRERRHLAGVLHDHLQQLIASALMQLAVAARDIVDEKPLQFLRTAESTLRDAFTVSRSVTVELSPPVLHDAGLVAGLEWFADRLREKHDFTVHIRADSSAEPGNEEERFLLYECTRELLFNALKHAGVDNAALRIQKNRDGSIAITVADKGAGFDTKAQGRLRTGHATFGLFSVQQRLAHLGGAVEIESEIGKGTRITVISPPPSPKEVEPRAEQAPRTKPRARKLRPESPSAIKILIADDQMIVRQALTSLLELEPDVVVVGEASSGPEVIERSLSLDPDVVLMDVDMGASCGIEATREILERNPDMKVLGLSMHNEGGIAAAMRNAGAMAYLTKDVAAEELLKVIREIHRA